MSHLEEQRGQLLSRSKTCPVGMMSRVDPSLMATVEQLRCPTLAAAGGNKPSWSAEQGTFGEELQGLVYEGSLSPRSLEQMASAAGFRHSEERQHKAVSSPVKSIRWTLEDALEDEEEAFDPTSLPFRERLTQGVPVKCVTSRIDWSHLAAVETPDALRSFSADSEVAPVGPEGKPRRAPVCVEINSGGSVFFGLLSPEANSGDTVEEVVVIKFCSSRHMLQSEQMAAELAWHLGIVAPSSRLLLRAHDAEEWQELASFAEPLNQDLGALLQQKQSMLLLQYIPGMNLQKATHAWEAGQINDSAKALGRLLVLDMLLGNADRLPMKSLLWRGNPSNLLFSPIPIAHISGTESTCCVPIDAVVARRPPRLLVQEVDQRVASTLELSLLDRSSAQEVLLEAVSCNPQAVIAVEADWAPSEPAWVRQHSASSGNTQSAVKSFHEGLRQALELALSEQGLLEMVVDVLDSWLTNFKDDMAEVARSALGSNQFKVLEREASENEEVRDRLASWQELLQQKSVALGQAVLEWSTRRRDGEQLAFRGFLGESVLNPVADAYELLVRLRHLVARGKVMGCAAAATRPSDLSPAPLLVGPATSVCVHLLQKLGVTSIINCTEDLPPPETLGDIQWHRLALADVEEQDLTAAFEEGLCLVDAAKAKGGRVLVHCHEGKSRSVSFCLAYFITREQRSLAEALAFVKTRRAQARPNAGFMEQLCRLEEATLGSRSISAKDMPKGKPKMLVCEFCGQAAGLTEEALAAHRRQKHHAVQAPEEEEEEARVQ